ncbi:MAG: superoxide dismutase [Patescibacteria group bacterium]|nr:superoxide dismutase [Patescibacteria group bacterium]
MKYEAENFDRLLGTQGFSDNLLQTHFKLYQGYVANTNKLAESLNAMLQDGKTATPEYSELKRHFGWEFNGMRLHEYYFGNMTKEKSSFESDSPLAEKMKADFGSTDQWLKDFKATGGMRGIGWTILYHDTSKDRLFNTWVTEHDAGHLSGATPLLVLDVFEHAYVFDYGMKRADYMEAFFNAVDWGVVGKRLGK